MKKTWEVDQIDKLQEDVTSGQQDATDKVVKKLSSERGYIFKKKGYEQQFRFNTEVKEHVLKTQSEAARCSQPPRRLQRCSRSFRLKEGT